MFLIKYGSILEIYKFEEKVNFFISACRLSSTPKSDKNGIRQTMDDSSNEK